MPSDKRFSEVKQMLEKAGYSLVRISGSHHYFVKPGKQPFSIPVHKGKVKPFYVRQVEKACKDD
jgi:predicted RNA binding protein YcfA (HicA-like mRNA interferase family)